MRSSSAGAGGVGTDGLVGRGLSRFFDEVFDAGRRLNDQRSGRHAAAGAVRMNHALWKVHERAGPRRERLTRQRELGRGPPGCRSFRRCGDGNEAGGISSPGPAVSSATVIAPFVSSPTELERVQIRRAAKTRSLLLCLGERRLAPMLVATSLVSRVLISQRANATIGFGMVTQWMTMVTRAPPVDRRGRKAAGLAPQPSRRSGRNPDLPLSRGRRHHPAERHPLCWRLARDAPRLAQCPVHGAVRRADSFCSFAAILPIAIAAVIEERNASDGRFSARDSGRVEAVELPVPAPPSTNQVLVRVLACGVCRTDLHVVDGELPDACRSCRVTRSSARSTR